MAKRLKSFLIMLGITAFGFTLSFAQRSDFAGKIKSLATADNMKIGNIQGKAAQIQVISNNTVEYLFVIQLDEGSFNQSQIEFQAVMFNNSEFPEQSIALLSKYLIEFNYNYKWGYWAISDDGFTLFIYRAVGNSLNSQSFESIVNYMTGVVQSANAAIVQNLQGRGLGFVDDFDEEGFADQLKNSQAKYFSNRPGHDIAWPDKNR